MEVIFIELGGAMWVLFIDLETGYSTIVMGTWILLGNCIPEPSMCYVVKTVYIRDAGFTDNEAACGLRFSRPPPSDSP